MLWNDFVNKLSNAKKQSLNNGLSVSCIANLIFAGAFDDMLGEDAIKDDNNPRGMIERYTGMFEEVRTALKSKAALPKKSKTVPMGLDELKDDTQLSLWRFTTNPMYKCDFLPFCKENLKMQGFRDLDHPTLIKMGMGKSYPMYHPGMCENFTNVTYLTNDWDDVFDSQYGKSLSDMFAKGTRWVSMVGVIVNAKKLPYGNGRTRISVDFYNGREVVTGLVQWPGRSTAKLPHYTKTMKKMTFGLITCLPKEYKGRKTGTIIGWSQLLIGV